MNWDDATLQIDGEDIGVLDAAPLQLQTDALETATRRMAETFAEYIIGEADTTLSVETFGVDAVREAIHELDSAGYRVTDRVDEPGTQGIGFAGVVAYQDLTDEWSEYARLPNDDAGAVDAPRTVGVDGVDVRGDRSLPDRTAVVVHPDATVPTAPAEASGLARMNPDDVFTLTENRPWDVKDPRGVVVVEVERDD